MNHWSAALVGLPYVPCGGTLEGCDCWGLVRLAYAAAGVSLPAYDGADPEDVTEKSRLFQQGARNGQWEPVADPRERDVALFRLGRHDSHVGVIVGPDLMLHADRSAGRTVIERIDSARWKSRLIGIYRHKDLA